MFRWKAYDGIWVLVWSPAEEDIKLLFSQISRFLHDVLSTKGFSVALEMKALEEEKMASLKFEDEFKEGFGIEIMCKSRPRNKAIGLGTNKETRERAAKAALAITTLINEGPIDEFPQLDAKQSERMKALLEEAQKIKPCVAAPTPTPHTAVPAPAPVSRAIVPVNLGFVYPEECAKDPFAELRDFQGQGPWPYCTSCNCWSDEGHIVSKKHMKALAWLQDSQVRAASSLALPPAPPKTSAPRPPPPPPPPRPPALTNSSWDWEKDPPREEQEASAVEEETDGCWTPDFHPPKVNFDTVFETMGKRVAFDWNETTTVVKGKKWQ